MTLSKFLDNSDIETTSKNFYYVRRNGLGSLRIESQNTAIYFYDLYRNRSDHYNIIFIILMVVGIILPFAAMAVLIPIVTSLNKINSRVLSMFGYISVIEITELANKCEDFIKNFLEDAAEKRDDYSMESKFKKKY